MPTNKPAKEPLKLMPLDQFGKLIEAVSHVPKAAVEDKKPSDSRKGKKPTG